MGNVSRFTKMFYTLGDRDLEKLDCKLQNSNFSVKMKSGRKEQPLRQFSKISPQFITRFYQTAELDLNESLRYWIFHMNTSIIWFMSIWTWKMFHNIDPHMANDQKRARVEASNSIYVGLKKMRTFKLCTFLRRKNEAAIRRMDILWLSMASEVSFSKI